MEEIYKLHPLERKMLPLLHKNINEILLETKLNEMEVFQGIQMLAEKKYANIQSQEKEIIYLSELGEKYIEEELPEIKFLKQLDKPKLMNEIKMDNKGEFSATLGYLKKNKLIEMKEGKISITKEGEKYLEKNNINQLERFHNGGIDIKHLDDEKKEIFEKYKDRGFFKIIKKKLFDYEITKEGEKILNKLNKFDKELVEELTEEMLKNKTWKNKEFRHYEMNIETKLNQVGRRHPMIEANNILRDVFVEMGFKEMEGPMLECAFWNMDIMWIPQDHPARDEQDTFYVEGEYNKLDKKLVEKVREMHEKGIKRTHTEKNNWSEKIASKKLLRTHSTSTSFRKLAELNKEGKIKNGKYFYIANNFRNEKVDATHLAEFFHAEGFIIGDNLGLADLIGFIKQYYEKLGITKIKFKPTFNPYTEPSMEAHYYDPVMKKWYALINSGIFRKETLEPLGIKKTIIAWGMGASRIATLLSGKKSMKEITGATCDFDWLKTRENLRRNIVKR
jgi:phenylalanyl-tRNA synthetase alpha chain